MKTKGNGKQAKNANEMQVNAPAKIETLQNAPAPTATANAAAKASTQKQRSLFLLHWDEIKHNGRGFCGAYKTLYNNAGDDLRAALIDPETLFNSAEYSEKKKAYFAYAEKKKAKDGGISPWYSYLWANAEMKEYRAKAQKDDTRAAAIAKVQKAEKVARQNAANAKK